MKSPLGRVTDAGVEPVEAPEASGAIEIRAGELRAVVVDGRRVEVRAASSGDAIFVWCAGETFEFTARGSSPRKARGGRDDAGLRSPMPGKVIRLAAAAGENVKKGATLLVLEAMKMEHEIRAPRDGVVRALPFRVGEQVEAGATLVDFDG